MIYVVDNGCSYSDHELYFVEAPEDFGAWLSDVLVPWLRGRRLSGGCISVLGTSAEISWVGEARSMSYVDFLTADYRLDEFCNPQDPSVPRPRYRGV